MSGCTFHTIEGTFLFAFVDTCESLFSAQTPHLQGHTKGKVDILQANGFTDVSAILCESTPVEEVKEILRSSPNSLFIVGGAMMKGFPDLMSELLAFIEVGK